MTLSSFLCDPTYIGERSIGKWEPGKGTSVNGLRGHMSKQQFNCLHFRHYRIQSEAKEAYTIGVQVENTGFVIATLNAR